MYIVSVSMPVEDFERFIKLLTEDREVAEQFQTIAGNLAAVIQFGKEAGCEFTIEDMRTYHEQHSKDLSEEQLDKVAGGTFAAVLPLIMRVVSDTRH